MKKRTDEERAAFLSGAVYGRMLPEFTVNLLVRDVPASLAFYRNVLGSMAHYADPDFAAVRVGNLEFMLHADHTYEHHPWRPALEAGERRGLGAELRILGIDPDLTEQRAIACGATVLRAAETRSHGWREVMVEDPDGYVWAVGILAPGG